MQPWLPTDDLLLEDYLIAQYEPGSELMLYATGPVLDNGSIAAIQKQLPMENGWVSMPTDIALENSVYTLQVKNDTLTIRHKATDTPVLLANGGKFSSSSGGNNAWIISPSSVESDDMPRHVISGIAGGKLYYFSFYLETDFTVTFRPTSSATQLHDLMLFAISDRNLPDWLYTSYPSVSGLTNTTVDGVPAYRMHIGSTILTIKNGKKYLQINE